MKSPDDVAAAFAQLPQHVTAKEIAEATGRSVPGVQNWITHDPDFPGESAPRAGRRKFRDKDAVLAWYLKQPFAGTDRKGRRGLDHPADAARAASPERERLTIVELATALGVTSAAVRYYISTHTPDRRVDPFPAAGVDRRRSWAQVRSWLLRLSDPLPTAGDAGEPPWEDVAAWLSRNLGDDAPERGGLTIGQRDLVERARAAQLAGVTAPPELLAPLLGLDVEEVRRLLEERADKAPARLGPAALARALGLSLNQVKHHARRYSAPEHADPFPAKDGHGTRDLEEVRRWFARHGKSTPAAF